jgi:hypothetical protein
MTKSLARAGLVALALAGCAGQLELPPEAYQVSAQSGGGGAGGGLTPSNLQPTVVPAPAPSKDDAGAGPAPTGAGTAGPAGLDASAPQADVAVMAEAAPAAPAPDAAPAKPSACPPGVEPLALLVAKCGNCHGEKMAAKNLDLVTAGVGARLVNVKSTCQDKPLLAAGAQAASPTGHFLDKLAGPVAGCGAQMPFGPPLTPAELECLTEWSAAAIARFDKR